MNSRAPTISILVYCRVYSYDALSLYTVTELIKIRTKMGLQITLKHSPASFRSAALETIKCHINHLPYWENVNHTVLQLNLDTA
jgi:hypothetical protein